MPPEETAALQGDSQAPSLHDKRIEQHVLALVLRQNEIAQYVSFGIALLAVYITRSYGNTASLLAWLLVLALLVGYRLWLIHRHGRDVVPAGSVPRVRRRLLVGLLLSGAAWASLPWIIGSSEPLPVYFSGIVLLGLIAGAVAAVSLHRSFFLAYTLPMWLSLSTYLLVMPVPAGKPAALLLLLVYAGLLRGSALVGAEVLGYLRLKLESEDARRAAEESALQLVDINEELGQRRQLMENLLRIVSRPTESLDARLQELLAFGSRMLDLRLGIVARIRDEDYHVISVVDRRETDAPIRAGDHQPLGETICAHTVSSDSPFYFASPEEADNCLHPGYRGARAGAYIGAPITTSDGRFGTLNFSDPASRRSFSAAETEFVRLLAAWMGRAISENHAVRQLHVKEKQLSDLTDAMPCGMASVSSDMRYRYVNRVFQHTFNADGEPLVGRKLENTHTLGGFTLVRAQFKKALAGKSVEFEYEPPIGKDELPSVYRINLVPNTDEDGEVDGCFVLVNDITDDRLRQSELERKASLDPLTLAYNRKFLEETLERIIRDRRRKRPIYIALVDLDDFKLINDTAGHEAGDQVLKKIATDLKADLRRGDVLARYGGDEFVLLLHCVDEDDLRATCAKVLERVGDEVFEYGGEQFRIGLSIGATRAVYGESIKNLMRRADQAMYAAKRLGKGRLEVAKPELVEAMRQR